MDVSNPVRSLAPSVDADLLPVLIRSHAWLTGARLAKLAGRSYAQVRVVLQRLVDEGLVDVERHGNAFAYRWNREHVVTAALEGLAGAADLAEQRLARAVEEWDPPAHALVVFGSFARGVAGSPRRPTTSAMSWRSERCNRVQMVEFELEEALVASLPQPRAGIA